MVSAADIEAAYLTGKSTWVDIDLDIARFGGRVRELEVDAAGLRAWAGDLYLAFAAAEGSARAVEVIDRQYVRRLEARILRLGSTADAASDALQATRERLFTGPCPRIGAYNAAGPLAQWIKVVAIRTAIDLHRANPAVQHAESALPASVAAAATDPTSTLLKQRYKPEFEEALRVQLAALSPRDRSLLRLYLVEGLDTEKIAIIHGVHRTTVTRRIWMVGETLLQGIRRHFRQVLGIVPKECDSLAHLVRSEIGLDLPRLLAD